MRLRWCSVRFVLITQQLSDALCYQNVQVKKIAAGEVLMVNVGAMGLSCRVVAVTDGNIQVCARAAFCCLPTLDVELELTYLPFDLFWKL